MGEVPELAMRVLFKIFIGSSMNQEVANTQVNSHVSPHFNIWLIFPSQEPVASCGHYNYGHGVHPNVGRYQRIGAWRTGLCALLPVRVVVGIAEGHRVPY